MKPPPTVNNILGRIALAWSKARDAAYAADAEARDAWDRAHPAPPEHADTSVVKAWLEEVQHRPRGLTMLKGIEIGVLAALEERNAVDAEAAAFYAEALEAAIEARIWKDMAKDIIAVLARERGGIPTYKPTDPATFAERRSGHVDGTDGAA
jgi:hypothetical protein